MIKEKTIKYPYDDADVSWWADFYGCPADCEDKEVWAGQFVAGIVSELLTRPFKHQIETAKDAEKATLLAQVDAAVSQRLVVE